MSEFVNLDNRIIPASETYISALSSSTFYGRGIFTTIAIYDSIPFQWQKHWHRIETNAAAINLNLNELTEEKVKKSLLKTIKSNRLINGKARLTFFDNSLKGIWNYPAETETSVLITTAEFQSIPADLRLTLSSIPINSKGALIGIKSCNYLENILILENVRKKDFDEAVRINESREIVSAVMANVFWVRRDEIFTPPLETGALAGTTRSFLLENFPVCERKIDIDELRKAEEIILTSAGLGIAKVSVFDNKYLTEKTVFSEIKKYFTTAIREARLND